MDLIDGGGGGGGDGDDASARDRNGKWDEEDEDEDDGGGGGGDVVIVRGFVIDEDKVVEDGWLKCFILIGLGGRGVGYLEIARGSFWRFAEST